MDRCEKYPQCTAELCDCYFNEVLKDHTGESSTKPVEYKMYVLMNSDGQFFRKKGYGGSGQSWVDDILKARLYTNIGGAKNQITWWSKNYPEYGTPKLVEFTSKVTNVIDMSEMVSERIRKSIEREAREESNRHKLALEKAKQKYLDSKRDFEDLLNPEPDSK